MRFHSCRLDSIFHNIIWHEYKSLFIILSCILFDEWILYQDDWDSDFDDESASQVGAQGNGAPPNYTASSDNSGNLALPAASYQSRGSIGDVSAIGRNDSKKGGGASSKTSFNRFSLFVKSGSENFILGKVNLNVPEADALTVVVRTVM